MKGSHKNIIMLAVALVIVSTSAAISLLSSHRYGISLLETASAQAENIAHNLALASEEKILKNDLVFIKKMFETQIYAAPAIEYVFIEKDGRMIVHAFDQSLPVQLISANTPIDEKKAGIEKIIVPNGDSLIDVAFPILGGQAGFLRMGLNETPYKRHVLELWIWNGAITLGILVVSLIVAHFVIGRLCRPLEELTGYAEKINAGSLDLRIPLKGKNEIAKLASAFNSMLVRIKEYTDRLEEYNKRLENKNEELKRNQKQMKTSFTISRELAALPKLEQICNALIESMKEIVVCRNLNLLIFNHSVRTITFARPNQTMQLGQEIYEKVYDRLGKLREQTFLKQHQIADIILPEPLNLSEQIAVFPIVHHDTMIGAMTIACSGSCNCLANELEILTVILRQAAGAVHRANSQEEEIRVLRNQIEADFGFDGIIGREPKMQIVFKLIEDVAPTDATVLIQGESGTGKELVARAIHQRSNRARKPFIVINCAAYPSTLLESELFGHEKGAFTGALRRKVGRFEQANGGTVFLDEIGEIELTAQTKLLRVLQQQTVDRLGGETPPLKVDVRIIAATNKNLMDEVRKKNFREDLFYRLNVIPIHLPPLRERRKDIHLLVRNFLEKFSAQQGKEISDFSNEAMRIILNASWPGNVRELENCIEHSVVLAKGDRIEINDLPLSLLEVASSDVANAQTIVALEENHIKDVLESCDWNKTEAARRLGISRSTLYEKLKRLEIAPAV